MLKAIQKIIKKCGKDILHYSPFDKINSYNLLDISDIVISFGSTVGIEATYYDKPSILWGSAYYEDTGGVYEVDSIEVLENMLKKDLKPSLTGLLNVLSQTRNTNVRNSEIVLAHNNINNIKIPKYY